MATNHPVTVTILLKREPPGIGAVVAMTAAANVAHMNLDQRTAAALAHINLVKTDTIFPRKLTWKEYCRDPSDPSDRQDNTEVAPLDHDTVKARYQVWSDWAHARPTPVDLEPKEAREQEVAQACATEDTAIACLRSVARYRAAKESIALVKDLADGNLPATVNRLMAINIYLELGKEPNTKDVAPPPAT